MMMMMMMMMIIIMTTIPSDSSVILSYLPATVLHFDKRSSEHARFAFWPHLLLTWLHRLPCCLRLNPLQNPFNRFDFDLPDLRVPQHVCGAGRVLLGRFLKNDLGTSWLRETKSNIQNKQTHACSVRTSRAQDTWETQQRGDLQPLLIKGEAHKSYTSVFSYFRDQTVINTVYISLFAQ